MVKNFFTFLCSKIKGKGKLSDYLDTAAVYIAWDKFYQHWMNDNTYVIVNKDKFKMVVDFIFNFFLLHQFPSLAYKAMYKALLAKLKTF